MIAAWLGLLLAASAASDWRRGGGDLFVRPPSAMVTEPVPVPPDGLAVVRAPVQPYAAAIAKAATAHGLDPKLLHALVLVESGYRPNAVSPVGARGLTQLMPATAQATGVGNATDVIQSLDGGSAYLAAQIVRFGDLRLALAAYNAGPGRVARLGRVPDLAETKAYVVRVVDCYLALTAGRSVRSPRSCSASKGPLCLIGELAEVRFPAHFLPIANDHAVSCSHALDLAHRALLLKVLATARAYATRGSWMQ